LYSHDALPMVAGATPDRCSFVDPPNARVHNDLAVTKIRVLYPHSIRSETRIIYKCLRKINLQRVSIPVIPITIRHSFLAAQPKFPREFKDDDTKTLVDGPGRRDVNGKIMTKKEMVAEGFLKIVCVVM
jgi:hypothetical protein